MEMAGLNSAVTAPSVQAIPAVAPGLGSGAPSQKQSSSSSSSSSLSTEEEEAAAGSGGEREDRLSGRLPYHPPPPPQSDQDFFFPPVLSSSPAPPPSSTLSSSSYSSLHLQRHSRGPSKLFSYLWRTSPSFQTDPWSGYRDGGKSRTLIVGDNDNSNGGDASPPSDYVSGEWTLELPLQRDLKTDTAGLSSGGCGGGRCDKQTTVSNREAGHRESAEDNDSDVIQSKSRLSRRAAVPSAAQPTPKATAATSPTVVPTLPKKTKKTKSFSASSSSTSSRQKLLDANSMHPAGSHRPFPSRPTLSPERARQLELTKFYENYNAMEGVVTALVLGGFFAFVCLLVLYKTKCKPMWKNRRKRLTNTPATTSMIDENSVCPPGVNGTMPTVDVVDTDPGGIEAEDEYSDNEDHHYCDNPDCLGGDSDGYHHHLDPGGGGSCDDDDLAYECIPLKSVFTGIEGDEGDEEEEDIYFLDEFGNYVFPVSSPAPTAASVANSGGGGGGGGGSTTGCACPHSAEEINVASALRRQSQVRSRSKILKKEKRLILISVGFRY